MATTNPIVSKALNAARNAGADKGRPYIGDRVTKEYWQDIGTVEELGEGGIHSVKSWIVRWDHGGRTIEKVEDLKVVKKATNSVRSTNSIVAKAMNAVARNSRAALNAKFKIGDKVEYFYGEPGYLGMKGTIVDLIDTGSIDAEPEQAKVKIDGRVWAFGIEHLRKSYNSRACNAATDGVYEKAINEASSRKFRPNDAVEWVDRHGNRNSGYYVRDNGPDRVTVSIERDGQGGGLEIPRAWIVANAVVANAKWVILYRDGGKEKIEAPSFDAAKKVAEQKSQASGRGYISVIVDDGVDYGVNARSRNSVVQKALNAVKNDTTPAVGSRWVHNDDNLFIVKVIGADGSSVRVQSADGGTCTYRLDEFLSDYRAANACKNAAAPSAELRRAYDDWQKAKAKFAKWWNPDRRLSERPPAGADEAKKAVAFSNLFLKEVGRRPPNGYGKMTLEQMLAK